MKTAVYAICKNEIEHVDRFLSIANAADEIVILDTGSNDGTYERLLDHAKVNAALKIHYAEFENFRFDSARNFALEQVSSDVDYCVWFDFDEILKSDWREKLEPALSKNPDLVNFDLHYHELDDVSEKLFYKQTKCHKRYGFTWRYPCHEVLVGHLDPNIANVNIAVHHKPDLQKERDYLPLLKDAVYQYENDQRCMFYYARELFYKKQYLEAITHFEKVASCKYMSWDRYVADSYKFIAYCYSNLDNPSLEEQNLLMYYALSLDHAEAYDALAMFYYLKGDLNSTKAIALKALELIESNVKTNNFNFRDLNSWSWKPHDLLAFVADSQGKNDHYLLHALKAYQLNPNDDRLAGNALDALCKNGYGKLSHDQLRDLKITVS